MPDHSAGPIKKRFLPCTVTLSMKPEESRPLPRFWPAITSALKIFGIIHNREFEEGVLRIEFYEEDASVKAAALLQKYRYIVYEV